MPYTPPTTAVSYIDVWRAKFFPYTTGGTLDFPSSITAGNPWEGIDLEKVKSIAPNLGAPRQIAVTSQGSVQTTFTLPPIDPQTIEAHLAYLNQDTYASLSGVKTRQVGGGTYSPVGVNKIGKSGLLMYNTLAAHDVDDVDVCVSHIFLSARAHFQWAALNENPSDITVNFSLGKKKKAAWGETLTELVDGTTIANGHFSVHFGQLNVVIWKGNGTVTDLLLPTDKPSQSTFADTFKVYNLTTGATIAGTASAIKFAATVAPANNLLLMGLYEMDLGI